jgi:hypothetical protein
VLATLLDAAPAPLRPAMAAELRAMPTVHGYEGIGRALVLARHVPTLRDELLPWSRAEALTLLDPRLRARAMVQVHDFLAEHG